MENQKSYLNHTARGLVGFLRRDLPIEKKMQTISATPSKIEFKSRLQIDDLK